GPQIGGGGGGGGEGLPRRGGGVERLGHLREGLQERLVGEGGLGAEESVPHEGKGSAQVRGRGPAAIQRWPRSRSERRVDVPAGTALGLVRRALDGVVDRVLLAPDAVHLAAALHLVHRAEPLVVLPRLGHGGSDAGRGEVWARRDVHRGQWWRPDGPGGGAVGFTDRVDAP